MGRAGGTRAGAQGATRRWGSSGVAMDVAVCPAAGASAGVCITCSPLSICRLWCSRPATARPGASPVQAQRSSRAPLLVPLVRLCCWRCNPTALCTAWRIVGMPASCLHASPAPLPPPPAPQQRQLRLRRRRCRPERQPARRHRRCRSSTVACNTRQPPLGSRALLVLALGAPASSSRCAAVDWCATVGEWQLLAKPTWPVRGAAGLNPASPHCRACCACLPTAAVGGGPAHSGQHCD